MGSELKEPDRRSNTWPVVSLVELRHFTKYEGIFPHIFLKHSEEEANLLGVPPSQWAFILNFVLRGLVLLWYQAHMSEF